MGRGGFRGDRELLFVAVLTVWLGGFWCCSGAWWHRWCLAWLVLPALLLNFRQVRAVVREERWLWLAAGLLVWQVLSRSWSAEPVVPMGWWLDAMLVFGLLCGVFVLARGTAGPAWVFPSLAVLAALVALLSLTVFYSHPERNLADDRLRNVLIYEHGLNAVLTGLLCAFGGLIAAWMAARGGPEDDAKVWRFGWLVVLMLALLGLLASQSRGPMLMFGVGFVVLAAVERHRIVPVAVVSALTAVAYSGLLSWASAGKEAAMDLIQRGSTGRLDMWAWFFERMSGWDGVFGKGMATSPIVPEAEFGWLIRHPHSVYVTQFYLTGFVGTALLLVLLGWGGQAALKLAQAGESLWLALLGGAAVALAFDGAHVFSLFSVGRLEILLLAVPAAMAVGRSAMGDQRGRR